MEKGSGDWHCLLPERSNTLEGSWHEPHERLKRIGAELCVMRGWDVPLPFFQCFFPIIYILHLHWMWTNWIHWLILTWIKVHSCFKHASVIPSLPVPRSPASESSSPNMQNMTRRFGRMTTKSSADDSQIAVLLKDFDDADMLLGKVDNVTPMTRVLSHFLIRVI